MPWHLLLAAADNSSDPLTAAIGQILSYGVLGVVALAFAFRFIVPRSAVEDARKESRADLLKDVERLERQVEQERADKRAVEEQRDEALKFTQANLVPLLVNFTSATGALIPLLQELVRHREGGGDLEPRWRR